MKINLPEIRTQIEQLLLQWPELNDDEVLRADMLEGETGLQTALSGLERRRQEAVALSNSIEAWINQIKHRQARFDARDEAIREIMFKLLQVANLKKVELPEATLSIKLGSPKVMVTDAAALPASMVRIKAEPDKIRIREALQSGATITGAVLSNAEDILAIRTK